MDNLEYEAVRDILFELLDKRRMKQLQQMLEEMNEFDVAEFLTELEHQPMAMVFRMLSKTRAAEVFANLEVDDQEYIINSITDAELGGIIEELYVDDAVDMMEELPANVVKRVMRTATSETRNLINQYLRYPENSAGSIMTAEFIDLKKYMNVRESLARIRRIGADKEIIYICYVTAADRRLEGVVTVKDLLLADDESVIEDIMDTNIIYVQTTDDQERVSEMFSDYDMLAMPVVDKEARLVGIVTVDDVIDVMEQEATEDFEKMAAILPSEKPYLKISTLTFVKNRIPWLMILMLSSTLSGIILDLYESVYVAVPLLVTLMPMLTGTGGNAGSQAATLVIRGMAVGEIEPGDILRVIWKEMRVAAVCGLILGVLNYFRIILMYPGQNMVAAVTGVALFVTIILAKTLGGTLPIIAKVCKLDPALMASPLISTLVDVVALTVYFSISAKVFGIV
ncbi:MAG: magnesium transporter [Candidatus Heteroscillospira sp.]|jgi:magnesium transporter